MRQKAHGTSDSTSRIVLTSALLGAALWAAPAIPAAAAPACTAPTSWPLGHHTFQFRHSSGKLVTSSGWDPAFHEDDNADKRALTAGVSTYRVGLPGNLAPSDLPRRWTFDATLTPAKAAAAGFPTVSLAGVSGPVYLIHGYNGMGTQLYLAGGVKVAISSSAFDEIRINSGDTGWAWIVDSLFDQGADEAGGFRIFGQNGIAVHVMYSEAMGGDDAGGKGRHVAFYRSHLHGADKSGGEHSDGIQINGGDAAMVIESTVDFLFRQTNGAVYVSAQNDVSNVDIVNNLISGGGSGIKGTQDKPGTYDNILICGNRLLGASGNTSWATDSTGGTAPIGNFNSPGPWDLGLENNRTHSGLTSGVDHLGRDFNFPTAVPVAAAQKSRLDAKMAQMEQWVSQVRAASGSGGGTPPPPDATAPAAPVLLP